MINIITTAFITLILTSLIWLIILFEFLKEKDFSCEFKSKSFQSDLEKELQKPESQLKFLEALKLELIKIEAFEYLERIDLEIEILKTIVNK